MKSLALAEALDRILFRGVSVEGNVTVGVAGVELLFLDLRLLLASVDTVWPEGRPAIPPVVPSEPPPPVLPSPLPAAGGVTALPPNHAGARTRAEAERTPPALRLPAAPRGSTADGLVRLVLTLVKLLHEVLERQAVRRMANGRLTDAQVEDVGAALLAQAQEIERLRRHFGFSDADLALDLRARDGSG